MSIDTQVSSLFFLYYIIILYPTFGHCTHGTVPSHAQTACNYFILSIGGWISVLNLCLSIHDLFFSDQGSILNLLSRRSHFSTTCTCSHLLCTDCPMYPPETRGHSYTCTYLFYNKDSMNWDSKMASSSNCLVTNQAIIYWPLISAWSGNAGHYDSDNPHSTFV